MEREQREEESPEAQVQRGRRLAGDLVGRPTHVWGAEAPVTVHTGLTGPAAAPGVAGAPGLGPLGRLGEGAAGHLQGRAQGRQWGSWDLTERWWDAPNGASGDPAKL